MTMLKIYEFIIKMQELIGNNSEVRLLARNQRFIIRVDWWDDGFHAMREFTERELSQVVDEGILLDYFVNYCRRSYAKKETQET